MKFTRPMLAASLLSANAEHTDSNILEAMSKLRYPVLATLKKDGVRCIKLGELASRTLKRIPNLSIQKRGERLPSYLDMELFNPELSYDEIESIVMSKEHPDSDLIQFHILDRWPDNAPPAEQGYLARMHKLLRWWELAQKTHTDCSFFMGLEVCSAQALLDYFKLVEQEAEGICFRTPDSPYKQGRSTLREQYLIKLARFHRTEVTVVGFKEQVMNTNAEKRNAVGMMQRRKTVGGVGKNTLGAFVCKEKDGTLIDVGTGVGLTDVLRKEIWDNKVMYVGKDIVVKHKPHGQKDKLRSPIFVGFRQEGF